MKKFIQLGQHYFVLSDKSIRPYYALYNAMKKHISLNEAYRKCSQNKRHIYDNILWALPSIESSSIMFHNSWTFTLGAIVEENNQKYFVYITPSHNYAMQIE